MEKGKPYDYSEPKPTSNPYKLSELLKGHSLHNLINKFMKKIIFALLISALLITPAAAITDAGDADKLIKDIIEKIKAL